MKTIKVGDQQLDLFAHDVSTSTPPAVRPTAPPAPPVAPPQVAPAPPIVAPAPSPLPLPPRTADGPPLRQPQLGSHLIEFALRRSTRRSIGFMIDDNGLRVTAPKRVTLVEIDNAIRPSRAGLSRSCWNGASARCSANNAHPWHGSMAPCYPTSVARSHCDCTRRRATAPASSARRNELHVWVTPTGSEQQLKEK